MPRSGLTDRACTCRIRGIAVVLWAGRLTFWQTGGMLGSDGRKSLSPVKQERIQRVEALSCNMDGSGTQGARSNGY